MSGTAAFCLLNSTVTPAGKDFEILLKIKLKFVLIHEESAGLYHRYTPFSLVVNWKEKLAFDGRIWPRMLELKGCG